MSTLLITMSIHPVQVRARPTSTDFALASTTSARANTHHKLFVLASMEPEFRSFDFICTSKYSGTRNLTVTILQANADALVVFYNALRMLRASAKQRIYCVRITRRTTLLVGRTMLQEIELSCSAPSGMVSSTTGTRFTQRESHLRTSPGCYTGANETHAYDATCSGRPSIAVHLRIGDVTSGKFDSEGNLSSLKGHRNYSSRGGKAIQARYLYPTSFYVYALNKGRTARGSGQS
jgi:hypothetical protein